MHSCYQSGTGSVEMFLMYKQCLRSHSDIFKKWRSFCQEWSWQTDLQRVILRQLTVGREKTWVHAYKGSASELLTLFPLVVLWCLRSAPGPEELSFFAMWEVISALQRAKLEPENFEQVASTLQSALAKHMAAHTRVYGDEHLLPKHHFMLHIPGQILRDKCMLDCFVTERKGKPLKALLDAAGSGHVGLEQSLLRRALFEQIDDRPSAWQTHLEPPVQSSNGDLLSLKLHWASTTQEQVVAGQMRRKDGHLCLVQACVQKDENFFVLVLAGAWRKRVGYVDVWQKPSVAMLIPLERPFPACIAWKTEGEDTLTLDYHHGK